MAKDFLRGTTRLPLVFLQVRYRGNGFGAFGTAHKQTYKGRLAFPLGGVLFGSGGTYLHTSTVLPKATPSLYVSTFTCLIVVIGFIDWIEVLARAHGRNESRPTVCPSFGTLHQSWQAQ